MFYISIYLPKVFEMILTVCLMCTFHLLEMFFQSSSSFGDLTKKKWVFAGISYWFLSEIFKLILNKFSVLISNMNTVFLYRFWKFDIVKYLISSSLKTGAGCIWYAALNYKNSVSLLALFLKIHLIREKLFSFLKLFRNRKLELLFRT